MNTKQPTFFIASSASSMDPNGSDSEMDAAGLKHTRRSAPRQKGSPLSDGMPRPPPSSYTYPFQAYPGNPDPGTPLPSNGYTYSRRWSLESLSNTGTGRRSLNL